MIKTYKRWNVFERKFFWLNTMAICILFLAVFFMSLDRLLEAPYKLGVMTGMIAAYAYYRSILWRSLSRLEAEWKGSASPEMSAIPLNP
ncbi:hypothetical protein HYX08_03850 [Candidatus Woesearchaeota archaeon]|nr:hypothetical protein [Candidatus Woesearchaeota archaeon]